MHSLKSLKHNIFFIVWLICMIPLTFGIEYFYGHVICAGPNSLGEYFNIRRWFFFFCVLISVSLIVRFRDYLMKKIEVLFVILALSGGLIIIASLPALSVISWDDETHYWRAINMSAAIGGYTQADLDFANHVYTNSFSLADINAIHQQLDAEAGNGIAQSGAFNLKSVFIYLAYIPVQIVMLILRLCDVPFHIAFVVGKIPILLTYVLLMYFAIKKLKSGKLILTVFALFPTMLFLAGNYSYDTWVTGWCALGIAYFIANMQTPEEKMPVKDMIIMIASFVIGFSAKAIYFPIMLLLLLLPSKKFSSSKVCRIFRCAVIVGMLILIASFVLPMFQTSSVTTDIRGGSDVNGTQQMMYILSHPLAYAKTLLKFMIGYLSVERAADYTSFFAYLGYGHMTMFPVLLLGIATVLDRTPADRYTSSWKVRIWSGILCFGTACLAATSMYIAFTPVGAGYINGCQPRYLLPLIFPLVYLTLGNSVKNEFSSKKSYYYFFCAAMTVVVFYTIWELIVCRYY